MSALRLSIILPVYNVEPYVERCLRSLLEYQNLSASEYEIIVTNDGSPDNSRAVVERLQSEFSNLILINQENQGVSMARNNAIAIAKGRYILPIDPDDYIVPHCLLPALEQAEKNNLDILYCAFEIFDGNGKSVWRTDYSELENRLDDGYEGYFAVRGPKVKDPDRSWAMFYRLDLLQQYQIQYPKDVPMLEDGLFLGLVFSVAQRVGYSDQDFYQRTTRPGSATQSNNWITSKTFKGYLNALNTVEKFQKANHITQKGKQSLPEHIIVKFIILALSAPISQWNFSRYIQNLKKVKKYIQHVDRSSVKMNYNRMFKMLRFSPVLFFFTYRFLK
jgi:glycosyltransferase involved in cell wall biosynthesis